MRRFGQVLTLVVLAILGIWLLARPGQPAAETGARQVNLRRAYGPPASAQSPNSAAQDGPAFEPAEPILIDINAVPEPAAGALDSQYDLWLRGEIDLDREASRISEVEMAERREASLARPPDANVQLATEAPAVDGPLSQDGFAALDASVSPYVPPDPEMAVGPNHVLVAVNVHFAIYDKSGNELIRRAPATLFQQAPCATNSALFDPNVLYDDKADRWILAYAAGPLTSTGGYCLLVSTGGNPLSTWYGYFFRTNSSAGWLDFPHAGVGDNHIYMAGNLFQNVNFAQAVLYAFPKAQLYAGQTVNWTGRGFGLGSNYFAPQPLKLHGYPQVAWPAYGNNHYFLVDDSSWSAGQYQLTYTLVRWNPVTDNLTFIKEHDLGSSGSHLYVPQPGGDPIEANDIRPLDFEYRNGHGWATMTVGCNPGGGVVNCLRWLQINLSNGELGPAGTGLFGSSGQHRFFGDLAVNHCGDMVIGYSKGGPALWPGIWYTGRALADAPGVLRAEELLRAGEEPYTSFEIIGDDEARRWGDYTAMTIDPDGLRFWYVGQYSTSATPPAAAANWGTYVVPLTVSPDLGCNQPVLDEKVFLPALKR